MAATPTQADSSTADTMVGGGHHYCIIADGGRQYRVSEGQELEVDFRPVEAGSELVLDKVLAVGRVPGQHGAEHLSRQLPERLSCKEIAQAAARR